MHCKIVESSKINRECHHHFGVLSYLDIGPSRNGGFGVNIFNLRLVVHLYRHSIFTHSEGTPVW